MESAEAMHGCIHLVYSFSTPTRCSEDKGFAFTVDALNTLVPRTSENRPENAGRRLSIALFCWSVHLP